MPSLTPRRLTRCFNIADLRREARRKLPWAAYSFLDGGAEDEVTLRRNTHAFDEYELVPNVLEDVAQIDTSTRVLGCDMAWPGMLSPTGASRFFHHTGELAVARAAARSGVFYALSTTSNYSLEQVAAAASGPKIFQLYVLKDRGLTAALVTRAKAAGYKALYLTVDLQVPGNRERDLATGLVIPPKPTLRSLTSFAARPSWSFAALGVDFRFQTLTEHVRAQQGPKVPALNFAITQFDRAVVWKDLEWLATLWDGPLAVKGVLSVKDARRALDSGASGVVVSNHGGRQLDGAPAPIDCIAEIRDAVGDGPDIILDGGVRRGAHILKALARGASACSFGRPYLYGLAAGGEAGVDRALGLLRAEVERNMALMGTPTIEAVRNTPLRLRRGGAPASL